MDTASERARLLAPGLVLVAAIVVVSDHIPDYVSGTSALIWALALGALIANSGLMRPSFDPGIRLASRRILRFGVALLGIRLSLGTVGDLGLRTIVVIVGSLVVTFVATLVMGRILGVSGPLTLLIATGTGICGASAIVAMESVSEASREEAAFALATITALGTVAMVGLPFLRTPLGLDMTDYGIWAGASVQEVAQVVGATAGVSAVALKIGTLVKLARVALLAPLVFGFAVSRGRGRPAGTPLVPLFVIGFLALAAVRSTDILSARVVADLTRIDVLLLAAGMAGLGLGLELSRLRGLGVRPLLLGFASWMVIALVSLALVTWV
ncbi:MAG: hypothetical protein QOE87_308 [Gaiellales bacterium]|nr:hypothetical protein [Gaiellales bacterium]